MQHHRENGSDNFEKKLGVFSLFTVLMLQTGSLGILHLPLPLCSLTFWNYHFSNQ
jgi:hypothetical protein